MPDLSPDSNNIAYQSGRAFAILEQIQQASARPHTAVAESKKDDQAQGRINATYGDRFFAGAVSNPRAALVTGSRNAKAWLRKLRRSKPGLANFFDRELDAVYALIGRDSGIPAALTLQQQAQFLLGYHHQRGHRTVPTPDPQTT